MSCFLIWTAQEINDDIFDIDIKTDPYGVFIATYYFLTSTVATVGFGQAIKLERNEMFLLMMLYIVI